MFHFGPAAATAALLANVGLMGRAVLASAASHLGPVPEPARRRQPPPPSTLRPDAAELKLRNEDGSMTAFDAMTPAQRFEFDVRGYFVLRAHYSQREVAAFNAGIDEVSPPSPAARSVCASLGRERCRLPVLPQHLAAGPGAADDPPEF